MAEKKPRVRKKTRTGKPLDPKTGKIVGPKKGRLTSYVDESGKKLVRQVTAEEERAPRVTELPRVERPAPTQSAPVHLPGTLKRGGVRGAKGFSVAYPLVHKAVTAAMGHLNKAHFSIAAGLNPKEHFENFDAIHANIKGMDKQLGQSLTIARHLVSVSGGKITPQLRQTHNLIQGRLDEGREHHEENLRRVMEGRKKGQTNGS